MPPTEFQLVRIECNAIRSSIARLKSKHLNPFNESRPSREELRNLQLIDLIPSLIRIDEQCQLYRLGLERFGDDEVDLEELDEITQLVSQVGNEIKEFLDDERFQPIEKE
jgi:hypothetical protein